MADNIPQPLPEPDNDNVEAMNAFNAAAQRLQAKNAIVTASVQRIRGNNERLRGLVGDLNAASLALRAQIDRIRAKITIIEQARDAAVNELAQLRDQPRADPADVQRLEARVAALTQTLTGATGLLNTASGHIEELIAAAEAEGLTPEQLAALIQDMTSIQGQINELTQILPDAPLPRGGRRGRKRGKTRKIKRRQHKQRGGFQYDKIVKRPSLKSLARSKSRSSSKSRTLSQTRSNRYRNKSRQRY